MNEIMQKWLTPDGLVVLLGLVAWVVLPFVAKLMKLAGKKEAAAEVEKWQGIAARSETSLASVVKGVHDARTLLSPQAAGNLVAIVKQANLDAGTEGIVSPIVHAIKDDKVAPIDAVRAVTRRVS